MSESDILIQSVALIFLQRINLLKYFRIRGEND